ncbi:MAG: hypothetical protein GY765_13700 [bacterium]|nr:hypothetical protein [bacterium]
MKKEEITAVLDELEVRNYNVADDGIVDVEGTVDISFKDLAEIPVQFGRVKGDFNCSNNRLTTLKGAPMSVGISFFCHKNSLQSLVGGPAEVGKAYVCNENQLTTLHGAPRAVRGSFDCSFNRLVSLGGGPEGVKGDYDCSRNSLRDLEGGPQIVGRTLYCTGNPVSSEAIAEARSHGVFLIVGD